MTTQQIREALAPRKAVSRPQLYRYLEVLNIEPVGARQKPQHYPEDTPHKILAYLGLPRIVSMAELREARRRAQAARPRSARIRRKGGWRR